MPGFGVYLHFPYCLSKCPYCDFASQATRQIPHQRFGKAIAREFVLRREAAQGRSACSLYIGGGTPSLWEPTSLAEVLALIRGTIPFATDAEWTLEANPGASDARRFESYRTLGFNRLSIGIQSFDPKVLLLLGRRHSGDEAI